MLFGLHFYTVNRKRSYLKMVNIVQNITCLKKPKSGFMTKVKTQYIASLPIVIVKIVGLIFR